MCTGFSAGPPWDWYVITKLFLADELLAVAVLFRRFHGPPSLVRRESRCPSWLQLSVAHAGVRPPKVLVSRGLVLVDLPRGKSELYAHSISQFWRSLFSIWCSAHSHTWSAVDGLSTGFCVCWTRPAGMAALRLLVRLNRFFKLLQKYVLKESGLHLGLVHRKQAFS